MFDLAGTVEKHVVERKKLGPLTAAAEWVYRKRAEWTYMNWEKTPPKSLLVDAELFDELKALGSPEIAVGVFGTLAFRGIPVVKSLGV